jgi:uncharacterized protein
LANVRSELSTDEARRVLLQAQGFADGRPSGRVDRRHVRRALGRIAVVQLDSVNVVVRSHELPLFSRLGAYPRGSLDALTYRDRELFEYWSHMASVADVGLQPSMRWRMAEHARRPWPILARLARERPGFVDDVLSEVGERGPVTAAEITGGGKPTGPWWAWADGKAVLEWFFWTGRLAAAGRGPNFERRYDLPERVLPRQVLDTPTPHDDDAHRTLLVRAARALGVATAKDLADYFRMSVTRIRPRLAELVEAGRLHAVRVDGWTDPAFLHPEARLPRRVDARALLSPFDSLVWDRARVERHFGMRYRIEIYTPAPKRVYGYYVLPFLLGDRLVARVDLKADRKASVLRAPGVHAEPGVELRAIAGPLIDELRLLADWLGLDDVDAPALNPTTRARRASSARSARSRRPDAPTR